MEIKKKTKTTNNYILNENHRKTILLERNEKSPIHSLYILLPNARRLPLPLQMLPYYRFMRDWLFAET